MKRRPLQILCLALLAAALPASALAISLDDAAKRAAKQHNAKVLSAKTIEQGDRRIHEIKLLTDEGVVKTVRIPDDKAPKKR